MRSSEIRRWVKYAWIAVILATLAASASNHTEFLGPLYVLALIIAVPYLVLWPPFFQWLRRLSGAGQIWSGVLHVCYTNTAMMLRKYPYGVSDLYSESGRG